VAEEEEDAGEMTEMTERPVWIERTEESGRTSAKRGHLDWQSRREPTAGQT
jgi:hypothetical protein